LSCFVLPQMLCPHRKVLDSEGGQNLSVFLSCQGQKDRQYIYILRFCRFCPLQNTKPGGVPSFGYDSVGSISSASFNLLLMVFSLIPNIPATSFLVLPVANNSFISSAVAPFLGLPPLAPFSLDLSYRSYA
jgi:hypothetical protein